MNRAEIKNEAKKMIVGNKWNIWWPVLVIGALEGIFTSFFGPNYDVETSAMVAPAPTFVAISSIVTLIAGIIFAGYLKYIINFVRTGKFESNDIIDTVKAKWLDILIATILAGIIISLCTCLLVIPGIIMSLAYAFVLYIVVDSDTKGNDALKASREMMNGHKWEFFVFNLSFIGWILLVPFTLGLLLIWLVPYMTVAEAIFYNKLKELK